MPFETTKDIIDHAKKFHQKLGEVYAALGERAGKEKLKLLLNYMSRHESHLVECIDAMESDASKKILETWFKYSPQMPDCECFECIDISADMSLEEVVDTALRVDQCLVRFYRDAAEKAVVPEVKDFFQKILDLEKKEESECLRNTLIYDEQG